MRERILYCEVQTDENDTTQLKRLEGLYTVFNGSRKKGDTANEAQIQIENLTNADIQFLSTYSTPYFKQNSKKKLRVFAGYGDIGSSLIYEGDIVEAIPSSQPDTTLNIKSMGLYYAQRTPVTFSIENTDNQKLAQSIADELNLKFDWAQDNQVKNISFFHFTGSKGELIKEYNKQSDVLLYEDNGVLHASAKKVQAPSGYVPLISQKSGMIGIPEPDKIGVKVRVLFNPQYSLSTCFKLESERMSGLNGNYSIYQMDYSLANRSTDFYIDILGQAIGT